MCVCVSDQERKREGMCAQTINLLSILKQKHATVYEHQITTYLNMHTHTHTHEQVGEESHSC